MGQRYQPRPRITVNGPFFFFFFALRPTRSKHKAVIRVVLLALRCRALRIGGGRRVFGGPQEGLVRGWAALGASASSGRPLNEEKRSSSSPFPLRQPRCRWVSAILLASGSRALMVVLVRGWAASEALRGRRWTRRRELLLFYRFSC
jgi:hypothetical protein